MRAKEWIYRGLVMLLVLQIAAPCVACAEPNGIYPHVALSDLSKATPLDSGDMNSARLGQDVSALAMESQGGDGNIMHTDHADFSGCWYAMPYLGSSASSISGAGSGNTCYDDRYFFDVDGTFIYGCDEADGLNRVRYTAGNWYIAGNRLYLEIWERIVWEGGREVKANGSVRTERMIENPTVTLICYDEPELEAHEITGPLSPAELGGLETAGRKVIKIDGQAFYGFSNREGLFNGFWEMKKLAGTAAMVDDTEETGVLYYGDYAYTLKDGQATIVFCNAGISDFTFPEPFVPKGDKNHCLR